MNEKRFAIAWSDITPPVGIYHRIWGAAKHDRSEGVHRPLRATVVRIEPCESEPSTAPLLWLALDHCLFGPPELELVLGEMRRVLDRTSDDVVVIFSHTHAAGLMTLDRQSLPGGDLIPDYLRDVGRCAAQLVAKTQAELAPANIVYGQGWCALAAHRDLWDKNRHEFVCGYHPDGPADGTVLAARVTAADGRILATLVNYACHPTTLARL